MVVIFDDLFALQEAIEAKEVRAGSGLSRLIAIYDWEYNNKKWAPEEQRYWKVDIGD